MNRLVAIGACLVTVFGVVVSPHSAASLVAATEDARTILVESDRRHRAKSEEYRGEVVVVARNGKERRKTWRSYRDGPAGSSDRFIRFLGPPDVRGVGYLAHHRAGKAPEEWLYLPSMKRERRIAARDREAAFVGTNFNYEDLDLLEFDEGRYDAELLPSQTVDGAAVHMIALRPRGRSIYAKKILTIRKDNLCLLTAEFFVATSPAPAKRLTFGEYTQVDGYLVASRIEIVDLRKGGRTIVTLGDIALDRPQPRDRYTIQNLLREDDDNAVTAERAPSVAKMSTLRWSPPTSEVTTTRLRAGFSGYIEGRSFAFLGQANARESTIWNWGTAFVRQTARIGRARLVGAVRMEDSSGSQVGPLAFDPADRNPRRSPVSVRELSVLFQLRPALDVEIGRFQLGWGGTDGYSPADAFLPRDLSDPLTDERLPLWGARLRGERRGVRFELIVTPTTTPWRLPELTGRQSPFASVDVFLVDHASTVPRSGFEAVRVESTRGRWDVGGWARTGVRPAPVLVADLDRAENIDGRVFVPLAQHFAHETAAGGQLSREYGGWVVRGELGVFHSTDASLGDAVIWTIGGSRLVGDGTFTATLAGNAIEPTVNPLLLLDRALLPAAILAIRELEPWGSWRAAWLGTFQTVGGVLSLEITKDLTDAARITAGADLPHGAALSPAGAFSGGKRLRAAVRWSW